MTKTEELARNGSLFFTALWEDSTKNYNNKIYKCTVPSCPACLYLEKIAGCTLLYFNPRKKSTSKPTSCGLASRPSWTAHELSFPRGLKALADVHKEQMPRSFKESSYLLFKKSFPLSNCRLLCRQLSLLSVLSYLSFHSSGHDSAHGTVAPSHLRKPQLPARLPISLLYTVPENDLLTWVSVSCCHVVGKHLIVANVVLGFNAFISS